MKMTGVLPGFLLGATNIFGGKSTAQMQRDRGREALHNALGLGKGDYTFKRADGSLYDFGLDGGSRYKGSDGKELNAYDLDMNNPLSNQAASMANSITGILGRFGYSNSEQTAAQIARGLMENAKSEQDVAANAKALLSQMGIGDLDNAVTRLRSGIGQSQDPKYQQNLAAYENGINTIFNPKTLSGTPPQPPQAPQEQAPPPAQTPPTPPPQQAATAAGRVSRVGSLYESPGYRGPHGAPPPGDEGQYAGMTPEQIEELKRRQQGLL